MSERPALLVDAMNLFTRSYLAFPTMSSHGYQMGGAIGFLKTLARLTDEMQPSSIYVVWEGGGSRRRRSLFSEYKMNRRPEKMNRFYEDDIPDTDENKKYQIVTLLDMLRCTPACQLYASDCEGDDVIAYLCTGPLRDQNKIIISSDKDMYQLLGPQTKQYSLQRRRYVTAEDVYDEFRVSTRNFALAKALCGDPSDNIPGVKGIGYKKVASLFPILGLDQDVLLQEMFDYCRTHKKDSRLYERILDSAADVKRNWDLVYLDGGMLSGIQATRVNKQLQNFKPTMDRMKLARLLHKDGISNFDFEPFFYSFHSINGVQNTSEEDQ